MLGRISRLVGALSVALALLTLGLISTNANSAGTKWVRKQLGWSGPGAAGALAGGGLDSLFITAATDTQRTVAFPASQIVDWEELGRQVGLTNAVSNGFLVEVTAHKWTGTADTLYARIEVCGGDGGCNMIAGSPATNANWATTPCLLLQTGATFPDSAVGGSRATAVRYQGYISVDSDAGATGQSLWMQDFRIKIAGDVAGSSPKLSGCRIYITYPQRAQP